MKQARTAGFTVTLTFVGTDDVEINMERIRARVALGGHDVPEPDVRRRYTRGFQNLDAALNLADTVIFYDNSFSYGPEPFAIRESRTSTLVAIAPLPTWARRIGMITGSEIEPH